MDMMTGVRMATLFTHNPYNSAHTASNFHCFGHFCTSAIALNYSDSQKKQRFPDGLCYNVFNHICRILSTVQQRLV